MTASYRVDFSDDPASTLRQVGAFLEASPVHHNVIHTLLRGRAGDAEPGRYWTVVDGAEVVGVVFQSPLDHKANLTPMPPKATQAAADAIAEQGVTLPEVEGEAATAAAFAGRWTEVRHTGAAPVLGMRLHQLDTPTVPDGVPGRLRTAELNDTELIQRWAIAFTEDVDEPAPNMEMVANRVSGGQMALWETAGGPVCMSGLTPPAAGVVRVGPVYTPREHRRHGYAAACVGAQSKAATDDGLTCILYTDLLNATSNSVYRSLGYRVIAEITRYAFDDSRSS
ncbi:MAG TPA: GNAT family N-acetyltransferase [Acidimicrobiales bacterium]